MKAPASDDRARLVRRGLGVALAIVTITLLLMQIAHRLVDAPEVSDEDADAVAAVDPGPGLSVTAIEPVRVKVEIDGEVRYNGVLCSGAPPDCPQSKLEFERASITAVELADLTRARVVYRGERVDPLGNLSTGRRLVFIEDGE